MIGYASRTGTKRNLDALRKAGWGLMLSATGKHRTEGFELYALDNGAWTAYQQQVPWDPEAFKRLLITHGHAARFAVLPDIVAGGLESLILSWSWADCVLGYCRLALLPVQNGMTPEIVAPHLSSVVGIFVGGDTTWKEKTLSQWGECARRVGCYLHVGRVNSRRRIRLCALAGADSFDGSSVSRYAKTLPRLDAERRQRSWTW